MKNGFIVNYQKIDDRFDPAFYHPSYFKILDSANNWKKISKIYKDILHPPEYERTYSSEGLQLIRSQNVRPQGINLQESPVYFSPEFLKKKKVVHPQKGDILIVRSGVNAGDVAVVEESTEQAIIGADTLLLRIENTFIPKFVQVFFFTDIGKKLINRYVTGATNKHVSPYFLKKVPLPKISKEKQKKCITLFDKALQAKAQKEAESEKLLNSIDDYLLSELGIKLPEKNDSLENRRFTTSFQTISGKRHDPLFYHYDKIELGNKYPISKLKDLVNINKGQSITSEKINDGPYPVIAGGQSSPYKHDEYNYKGNVITVSASGAYSGYVWYHKNPIFASDCSVMISKDENRCNTKFLFWVLNCLQDEIYKLQQGAAQPHVYPDDLKNIEIPLPDLDKQLRILEEVKIRNSKAQQFEKEAEQELENARRQVEEMILEK